MSTKKRFQVRKKERKKKLAEVPRGLLSYHTSNKVTSCLLVRQVTDTTLCASPRNTTPVYSQPVLFPSTTFTVWCHDAVSIIPGTETWNPLLSAKIYDARLFISTCKSLLVCSCKQTGLCYWRLDLVSRNKQTEWTLKWSKYVKHCGAKDLAEEWGLLSVSSFLNTQGHSQLLGIFAA